MEKWHTADEIPLIFRFGVSDSQLEFQFEIGQQVRWVWRGYLTHMGQGIIVDRYYRQPGLSSPGHYYLVRNENDEPFPLELLSDREFEKLEDMALYEFISGYLSEIK